MSPYAADTEVPVERSKAQIQAMLRQRGATEYIEGWNEQADQIQFGLRGVTIRFVLPRVKRDAHLHDAAGRERPPTRVDRAIAQADRQRWRALYLVIKAKLEAVDAGIAVYEEEFLAFVVMRNGQTIGEVLVPQLAGGKTLQLTNGDGK